MLTADAATALVVAYLDEKPGSTEPTRAAQVEAVAAWIAAHGVVAPPALTSALAGLIAAASEVGAAAVFAAIDADAGIARDPDDTRRRSETAAEAATAGRVESLARTLIDSAAASAAVAAVVANLQAVVVDPAWAAGVADAVIAEAVAAAAAEVYRAAGVEALRWVIDPWSRVCGICLDNDAASPRPLGEPWPSGAVQPPQHPRCHCALIPEANRRS